MQACRKLTLLVFELAGLPPLEKPPLPLPSDTSWML